MRWKTSISRSDKGEVVIRGHKLSSLIKNKSFTEVAWLLIAGYLPNKRQLEIVNAIFVAVSEHGVGAPTAFVPRVTASIGGGMSAALATGVLSVGEFHGGAIEQAAKMLQSGKNPGAVVREALAEKSRIPGYGHKIYKNADPRAQQLLAKAADLRLSGAAVKKALAIETEIERQKGTKLPLNIDGAIAAITSDLKLDWRLGRALFIFGRMPGMIAHAHEEMTNEKPYRRIEETDIEYYETKKIRRRKNGYSRT